VVTVWVIVTVSPGCTVVGDTLSCDAGSSAWAGAATNAAAPAVSATNPTSATARRNNDFADMTLP
jgi:hypothetical protein